MPVWISNVFRLGLKELASLASDKVLFAFIVYSFSFSVYSVATGVKTETLPYWVGTPVARPSVAIGGITSASREAVRPIVDRTQTPYFYTNQYEGGVCDANMISMGAVSWPMRYDATISRRANRTRLYRTL